MPQDDLIENATAVLNHVYDKETPMTRKNGEKTEPDVEKIHLEPCPCGKTPDLLIIEMPERAKWGRAFGDCCSEWAIEFRNGYTADGKVSQKRAAKAWNETPRGKA